MKRLIAYSIFVCLIIVNIFSCSNDNPPRQRLTPKQRAMELKTALDLTDEQSQQIEQILIESRHRMAEDRGQFQGDREAIREVMREHWEETERQIEEILNDEQKEKYQELRQQREERRRSRRTPPMD